MLRKSCIKGFPKEQAGIIPVYNVPDAVLHRLEPRNAADEVVWYGAGSMEKGHTFGLHIVVDENGDVDQLVVFDQNKPMGFNSKGLWGSQTSVKWVLSMYEAFPWLVGKVNHVGSTEDQIQLTKTQKFKLRGHLAGDGKRKPIVCSTWAHLLGYPKTVDSYYERAAALIGDIIRAEDMFHSIEVDMGRKGRPSMRSFTSTGLY